MSLLSDLNAGIIRENPVMRLMIGLCPVLAVSNNAINALGMGIATAFVLICSNLVVALIRKFTPDDGYLRMRFKPDIIRKALDMRKKGYSSAEVKEHLQRYESIKVSRWTIIKWERKFK